MGADLDDAILGAATEFVDKVEGLMPASPAIRTGVQTQSIVSLVWALYDRFPDLRYDLIEALDDWKPTLSGKMAEERAAAS